MIILETGIIGLAVLLAGYGQYGEAAVALILAAFLLWWDGAAGPGEDDGWHPWPPREKRR